MTTKAPDMIECPHCHKMTSTASGFCDECGLELNTVALKPVTAAMAMATGAVQAQDKLTCPFCGFKLRPGARHCPNCGKKLTNVVPAPQEVELKGPPSALKVGLVIAERYGIEGLLGQGGMGRAWKAHDRNLNKTVVIKTVVADDPGLRDALQKEAETLINIRHPNIVAVIDFFLIGNELCYVMEFVDGPSWADEIEEPVTRKLVLPMPAEQALLHIKGLLPAFKYLHSLTPPIIYCDFKPSNVKRLTLASGEQLEVLLDFGTAYRYDPNVPPKPARGTPGYHSPQAMHPDWRDDYFTIGRTLAELIGMAEVHTEQYRYTLTPPDVFPWIQYDDSLRYFVEWLTAQEREQRPQNVDQIMAEIDGVIGYVKGQTPDMTAFRRQREQASFQGVTLEQLRTRTETGVVTGTVKIELPEIAPSNPASTVLLGAQEAYQQHNYTRALLLANQAVKNNGGASAYLLRSLIHTQNGKLQDAEADLKQAQSTADPQAQWELLLAEGQFMENSGRFQEAADRYRRMMALKPGDHRARLLLADLYRRSGNTKQAIAEYQAIIQAKPSVGAAYIGASKAYLADKQVDAAIKVLEDVSSRNTSYNDVMLELISLYNLKADEGDATTLDNAARAVETLRENGVETRAYYRLLAEFYFTAFAVAQKTGKIPAINWPDQQMKSIGDISKANEHAWREYLARDDEANREWVINERIMKARTWALV
ncbi:MAG: tetratricopeptide repeat protein [Chloroflexi bacterium]|nr:tetratricopeptide repeat protein [Chloroflexota bacterium]